jgi:hypothetical protein
VKLPGQLSSRSAGVGALCILPPVVLVIVRPNAALCYALTFASVIGLSRTRLVWATHFRLRPVIRSAIRILAYLAPLVALGPPKLGLHGWSLGVGAVVAAVGVFLERSEVRRSLSRDILILFAYDDPVDKSADTAFFLLAGGAQEYLHRAVGLAALAPLGWWVVPATTVLFLTEHLTQMRGIGFWDKRDVVWQIVMSLILGGLSLVSGGVGPAILAHTFYNFPNVIRTAVAPIIRHAPETT